jgi:hypothetical protein
MRPMRFCLKKMLHLHSFFLSTFKTGHDMFGGYSVLVDTRDLVSGFAFRFSFLHAQATGGVVAHSALGISSYSHISHTIIFDFDRMNQY